MPHFFHSTELWIFFAMHTKKEARSFFLFYEEENWFIYWKFASWKFLLAQRVEKESGLTWEILFLFVTRSSEWCWCAWRIWWAYGWKSSSSLFENVKDLLSWTFHKQMRPTTFKKLHRVANQKTVIQEFIKLT